MDELELVKLRDTDLNIAYAIFLRRSGRASILAMYEAMYEIPPERFSVQVSFANLAFRRLDSIAGRENVRRVLVDLAEDFGRDYLRNPRILGRQEG
jgi:hypothetical protein